MNCNIPRGCVVVACLQVVKIRLLRLQPLCGVKELHSYLAPWYLKGMNMVLICFCQHPYRRQSLCNSNLRSRIVRYTSSIDVLTVLLLVLQTNTWFGIKDDKVKAEFQSLVLTYNLPDLLEQEVPHSCEEVPWPIL